MNYHTSNVANFNDIEVQIIQLNTIKKLADTEKPTL